MSILETLRLTSMNALNKLGLSYQATSRTFSEYDKVIVEAAEGMPPCTNGERIILPPELLIQNDDTTLQTILHESFHIAFGTFDRHFDSHQILNHLVRDGVKLDDYFTVNGIIIWEKVDEQLLAPMLELNNIVEDAYIEGFACGKIEYYKHLLGMASEEHSKKRVESGMFKKVKKPTIMTIGLQFLTEIYAELTGYPIPECVLDSAKVDKKVIGLLKKAMVACTREHRIRQLWEVYKELARQGVKLYERTELVEVGGNSGGKDEQGNENKFKIGQEVEINEGQYIGTKGKIDNIRKKGERYDYEIVQ